MNLWRECLLGVYYLATQPARRRAAIDRAARQTEPVRVLFYHRVADEHRNAWTISTRAFAQQIAWLRARFDLVSLAEAQRRIVEGRNRWPTVCLTFDDGYADNMRFAVPLLAKHRIPFTYFVSTHQLLRSEPFPHDVKAGRPLQPNTPDELRQMRSAIGELVEIGAHSRSHADLGPLPDERLVDEIVGSKFDLERAIGEEARYFAFPFGQIKNLSAEAFRVAHQAGYRGVCSAYGGYNFPGDDSFHIRRFHADNEMIRFKNWLTIDRRKLQNHHDFDPGDYRAATNEAAQHELQSVGTTNQ